MREARKWQGGWCGDGGSGGGAVGGLGTSAGESAAGELAGGSGGGEVESGEAGRKALAGGGRMAGEGVVAGNIDALLHVMKGRACVDEVYAVLAMWCWRALPFL